MSETRSGPEAEPEARYANYFNIGFNAYEFVIDFGQEYPPGEGRVHTRIVASTPIVRDLSETLERSLRDYEAKFGSGEKGE